MVAASRLDVSVARASPSARARATGVGRKAQRHPPSTRGCAASTQSSATGARVTAVPRSVADAGGGRRRARRWSRSGPDPSPTERTTRWCAAEIRRRQRRRPPARVLHRLTAWSLRCVSRRRWAPTLRPRALIAQRRSDTAPAAAADAWTMPPIKALWNKDIRSAPARRRPTRAVPGFSTAVDITRYPITGVAAHRAASRFLTPATDASAPSARGLRLSR